MSVIVEETVVAGHARPAYVVRPAAAGAAAPAILWLHWLGNERSDRSEFLTEAVEMAALGCVSLLPDGDFPWHGDPVGTPADREAVEGQRRRVAAAVSALAGLPGVDPSRTAVVGHDYGGMYTLAAGGFDARAVVVLTPDDCWHHWFVRYWLDGADPGPSYAALFDDVDPVRGAAACQDRLLLQWAEHDEYVPAHVPTTYAEAAPRAWSVSYRRRDHRVGAVAAGLRREFLTQRLGLAWG